MKTIPLFLIAMLAMAGYVMALTQTFVSTANNTGMLDNFPAPILFDTSTPITAGQLNASCLDGHFADENGTELDYYFVPGTCNTNHTMAWVRFPSYIAGNNTAVFTYGNFSRTSTENASGVFVNNYSAVYLNGSYIDVMRIDKASYPFAPIDLNDSFTNGIAIHGYSNPEALNATNASAALLARKAVARNPYAYGLTVSGYIFMNSARNIDDSQCILGLTNQISDNPIYSIFTSSTSTANPTLMGQIRGGSGIATDVSTISLPVGEWSYFASSMQSNYTMEYSNGTHYQITNFNKDGLGDFSGELNLISRYGYWYYSGGYNAHSPANFSTENFFIATAPRSHDWLAAESSVHSMGGSPSGGANYSVTGWFHYPNTTVAHAYYVFYETANASNWLANGFGSQYSGWVPSGMEVTMFADVMIGGTPSYITNISTTIAVNNTVFNITLHENSPTSGYVFYENGSAAIGIIVTATNATCGYVTSNATLSDGSYYLDAYNDTAYLLAGDGASGQMGEIVYSPLANITMGYPHRVGGVVRYPNGTVSTASAVYIRRPGCNLITNSTTTAAGLYVLETPLRYWVIAASESSEFYSEYHMDSMANITVNFQYNPYSINGTIYYSDASIAAGLNVYLYDYAKSFVFGSAQANSSGNFSLAVWNQSDWMLCVLVRGNCEWFERSSLDSPVNMTLAASPNAHDNLYGYLSWGNGTPAEGWTVYASNDWYQLQPDYLRTESSALTDSYGHYTMTFSNSSGLEYSGWAYFVAQQNSASPYYVIDYKAIATPEEVNLTVPATIWQYVFVRGGEYGNTNTIILPGATVSAYLPSGGLDEYSLVDSATADENGTAALSLVLNQTYVLLASYPGYGSWSYDGWNATYESITAVLYPDNLTNPSAYGINYTFLPPGNTYSAATNTSFGVISNFATIGVNAVDYWGVEIWNSTHMIYNQTRASPTVQNATLAGIALYMHDRCYLLLDYSLQQSCLLSYDTDFAYQLLVMNASTVQVITHPVFTGAYSGDYVVRVFYHRPDVNRFVSDIKVFTLLSTTPTPTPFVSDRITGALGELPSWVGMIAAIFVSIGLASLGGNNPVASAMLFNVGLWLFFGAGVISFALPVLSGLSTIAFLGLNKQ